MLAPVRAIWPSGPSLEGTRRLSKIRRQAKRQWSNRDPKRSVHTVSALAGVPQVKSWRLPPPNRGGMDAGAKWTIEHNLILWGVSELARRRSPEDRP
jgi:hypothetical protein